MNIGKFRKDILILDYKINEFMNKTLGENKALILDHEIGEFEKKCNEIIKTAEQRRLELNELKKELLEDLKPNFSRKDPPRKKKKIIKNNISELETVKKELEKLIETVNQFKSDYPIVHRSMIDIGTEAISNIKDRENNIKILKEMHGKYTHNDSILDQTTKITSEPAYYSTPIANHKAELATSAESVFAFLFIALSLMIDNKKKK